MQTKEILMITSFPPRKCGIATYSQDLIKAIEDKYENTFKIKVCALKKDTEPQEYPAQVKYFLNSWQEEDYIQLANTINNDKNIALLFIQHEFGLFGGENGNYILSLLSALTKPIITTFHTILTQPDSTLKTLVKQISNYSTNIIVMTNNAANILEQEYDIEKTKINIIAHGTHLVKQPTTDDNLYPIFEHKKILSTFGLISEGKSIETALYALPQIILKFPNIIYMIIGKTHPEVLKNEGEKYRDSLHKIVKELNLQKHVLFINKYLSLNVLLEYLQRTDIYLFTSKDPQQAVSGTLAYALSAGCPVVSTPIPHSLELLDGAGINFDFQDIEQLANAVIKMLDDPKLMEEMRMNALHRISPTAWENSAISHTLLFQKSVVKLPLKISYKIPEISLAHIKSMTTTKGLIQFSNVAEPDIASGYTLDDNARALIAIAKHFDLTGEFKDLALINLYLNFIIFCQQEDGSFLNYVDIEEQFCIKNENENLEDSNGRAIWALGEFLSLGHLLDFQLQEKVELAFDQAMPAIQKFQSPRAIAFAIKGLHFYHQFKPNQNTIDLITKLADNLVSKYRGVKSHDWHWYEEYLTYANSLIPQAMLFAYKSTGNELFKTIALESFSFLMDIYFVDNNIKVVSNKGWLLKGKENHPYGEQPIEIAYTIMALDSFYLEFKNTDYLKKLKLSFNWFLGQNHLNQIVYNPATGGCYDGLEQYNVNLNQGAESTISYLLSRLTIESYLTN